MTRSKNRPRHGSKAHYPRKRTNRIYPALKTCLKTDKEGTEGFIGYKAGMTHIIALDTYENSPSYGQEVSIPVTVLECPALKVYGVRAYEKTYEGLKSYSEYYSDKIDKHLELRVKAQKQGKGNKEKIEENKDKLEEIRLLVHTQPWKAKIKKKPEVIEIPIQGPRIEEKLKKAEELLGKEITVKQAFNEGEYIDTIGVTKGKGTTGPVKRFGIKLQVRKAKGHRRHPGSIGSCNPPRVLWTVPMSGQSGYHKRTEYNKRILKIGEEGKEVTPKGGFKNYGEVENDYLIIKGSIQGPAKRPVVLRHAVRPKTKTKAPEVITISTESKQGK